MADGSRRNQVLNGCTGWEQVEWSADGTRLYTRGESDCPDGTKGRASELFGMSLKGEWLDVLSVTSGENTGVRVVRYQPGFGVSAALPSQTVSMLHAQASAIDLARTAAASRIGPADVAEAARKVEAGVVQAWLLGIGQPFELDAKRLVELADAKVPDPVIDLMVALTYPNTFSLETSQPTRVRQASRSASGGGGAADCVPVGTAAWSGSAIARGTSRART